MTATLLCALALHSPALAADGQDEDGPGRSEDRGHPVAMSTVESDCIETNTYRDADYATVAGLLPEGWTPNRIAGTAPRRSRVVFVDFTCESFSIDGLPARRTSVSWLAVLTARTSTIGTPKQELRQWTLEHGSDNPLFVERLRKMGIESDYLPRTDVAVTANEDGTVTLRQSYVDNGPGAGHDYVREARGPRPSGSRVSSSTFWFATPFGDRSITYQNQLSLPSSPAVTEVFGPGSVFRQTYGISDLATPTTGTLLRLYTGSWTSEVAVAP